MSEPGTTKEEFSCCTLDDVMASISAHAREVVRAYTLRLRGEVSKLGGQAEAWRAVWDKLNEDESFFGRHRGGGLENALAEIQRLRDEAAQSAARWRAEGDAYIDAKDEISRLRRENRSLVQGLPCLCLWSGSVGPEGAKIERQTTCPRCQKLGTYDEKEEGRSPGPDPRVSGTAGQADGRPTGEEGHAEGGEATIGEGGCGTRQGQEADRAAATAASSGISDKAQEEENRQVDEAFVKLVTILQTSSYSAGASGGGVGREEMISARAAIIDCYAKQERRIADLRGQLNKASIERAWALGKLRQACAKPEPCVSHIALERAEKLLKEVCECYFLRRSEGLLEILRRIDRFLAGDEQDERSTQPPGDGWDANGSPVGS